MATTEIFAMQKNDILKLQLLLIIMIIIIIIISKVVSL